MTGLLVGMALSAPWLTASWLRQRGWLQVVLYAPIAFGVTALMRNATGTDENLTFNISPWPAIPVFGLEIAAYTGVGLMLGCGLGCASFGPTRRRPALRAAAFAVASILPVVWFHQRFPSAPGWIYFAILCVAGFILAFSVVSAGSQRARVLQQRGLHLCLGALLVALPLFSGRALADGDYTVSKYIRAQTLIDALAAHRDREDAYPDELQELVDRGFVDALPVPRVGFSIFAQLGWLSSPHFTYRNLGSSYVLEFVSTEWVMCTYNPPWDDEWEDEEEAEEDEAFEDDEATGEVWSCPDTRPELW
jgi:hypothetical protein